MSGYDVVRYPGLTYAQRLRMTAQAVHTLFLVRMSGSGEHEAYIRDRVEDLIERVDDGKLASHDGHVFSLQFKMDLLREVLILLGQVE